MFTRKQYESALRELGRGIREGQRRMLAAHANAPGGLLDVSELGGIIHAAVSTVTSCQALLTGFVLR